MLRAAKGSHFWIIQTLNSINPLNHSKSEIPKQKPYHPPYMPHAAKTRHPQYVHKHPIIHSVTSSYKVSYQYSEYVNKLRVTMCSRQCLQNKHMSSAILLPPRAQLCIGSCSNKHQYQLRVSCLDTRVASLGTYVATRGSTPWPRLVALYSH